MVNIIIGQMGSCKSIILGHLQPFATLGTLDDRSQDDVIIPEMNGEKRIVYKNGSTIYTITHTYTWVKTSHMIKSSIERNGVELNPNGNQGSFKAVILNEFDIEQDFLKLFRVGTNVSNIISMKSTERKAFIASLLRDAETFILLNKKLLEAMRNLNTQTSVLTNKLNHIGAKSENLLRDEYDSNAEEIETLTRLRDEKTKSIFGLKAQMESLLNGEDISSYKESYRRKQNDIKSNKEELYQIQGNLKRYESAPPINEVSKILGGLDNELMSNNEKLSRLEERFRQRGSDLGVLIDGYKISKNKEHMNELENTYNELLLKSEKMQKDLKGFNCEYSISFLTNLLGDLNTINILIEEVAQYGQDTIKKLYNSDPSIVGWSKKQQEFIYARKMKLQKEINNIRFSEKYEAPSILYLPPLCPTKTCPYYKTHPFNIQKDLAQVKIEDKLTPLQDQMSKLDVEGYVYADYPYVYSKISTLKSLWGKSRTILTKLGVLKTASLLVVLTNFESRIWYNYDGIINIMELCNKRESYNKLVEDLSKMKAELTQYKLYEDNSIDKKIESMKEELDAIISEISLTETASKQTTKKITEYNQLYIELSERSIYEKREQELSFEINNLSNTLSTYQRNIEIIQDNEELIRGHSTTLVEITAKLKGLINKNETIKATLNDIKYTKAEFTMVLEEKENLKYILDAVSSKEGIPLKMAEMFLTDSKDILNNLIADVFEDSLEILDFVISEDDFYIPYSINGNKVRDIERASQGQKAMISLALSFALIQQSSFTYNIMLLDEVDGPLYKHVRERFLNILFKQLEAINAEQVFLISHNNTFDGYPVNIIMTTDEIVDKTSLNTIMHI